MVNRSSRTTWKDVLFFWAKVLVICIILGVISFFIGRNYLGNMIAETTIEQGTPEIVAQVPEDRPPAPGDEAPPPEGAKVDIYERDPSDAEVARARQEYTIVKGTSEDSDDADEEADQEEPDATEETPEEPEDETPSDEPADESATDTGDTPSGSDEDGREFVVIAGSFVNIENAEKVVSELRGEGYEPYITQVIIGDRTYNRVNVAAYSSREKAGDLARELRGSGHDVTVGVR